MINIPVMKKDETITPKRFKEIIAENVGKFVLCNQKEIDKQGSLKLVTYCVVGDKVYRAKMAIGADPGAVICAE